MEEIPSNFVRMYKTTYVLYVQGKDLKLTHKVCDIKKEMYKCNTRRRSIWYACNSLYTALLQYFAMEDFYT